MLFKQTSKKSLAAIAKLKPKLSKKSSISEKMKKPLKSKTKKSEGLVQVPRTCFESPVSTKTIKRVKRTMSCESQRSLPVFAVQKAYKKLPSGKERNRVNKNKVSKNKNLEQIVISPIKKIRLEFLNKEDQSILKALEII